MKSVFKKLMPTRDQATPDYNNYVVVADLDAFISEPIAFKFNGQLYEIKPVDTESFMRISRNLDEIRNTLKQRALGEDISDDQVHELYHKFFFSLCPKINIEDVKRMTVAQTHALLSLFIRHLTGQDLAKITHDAEKKNSMNPMKATELREVKTTE